MKENDIATALLAAALMGGIETPKTEPTAEENIREKAKKLGGTMYQTYLGFKDAGFTDEQAFQITLTIKKG